jgi:hypothetical protein
MYFLALSHAPPAFEKEMASYIPEAIAPASNPLTPLGPNKNPVIKGERMTNRPGGIICLMDDLVDISMHL